LIIGFVFAVEEAQQRVGIKIYAWDYPSQTLARFSLVLQRKPGKRKKLFWWHIRPGRFLL